MFSGKYRAVFFVIVLGLLLSSITVSTNIAGYSIVMIDNSKPSATVWSDDFENTTETLNQWTFGGINYTIDSDDYTPNITLSNGMLYSDGPDMNEIFHNSTTTVGTWSLDVFLENGPRYSIFFVFMSPSWDHLSTSPSGYALHIYRNAGIHHFYLGYFVPDLAGSYLRGVDETSFDAGAGWRRIDITRQSDNTTYVYHNGTLILEMVDTHVSNSEYFGLVSDAYTIFDNITVSDTVDIDGVAPHWIEPLNNQSINEGDDFLYTLQADDYSGLDTWWVGDTANFAIDQAGNLTSVAVLPAGIYGVEVFVSDTFGNVLSGTFYLEIISLHPTTSISPTTPLPTNTTPTSNTNTEPNLYVLSMYGAAGVAWFVAVIFIFRDYRKRRNA